jgi:hypothetical protein
MAYRRALLDAEELVVLRDAVAAAHGAGLDLAAVRGDGDVGDGASSVSPERWLMTAV